MVFRAFVLFLAIFSIKPTVFLGQTTPLESITIEDGLSQGMIYDILQTRDGFLWVATKDGLNRYDGHNFKVFTNDPFDPFSLAENTVITLFEDSRGWLWIGTESKGLDLYDPKTGRFHHFNLNAIEISSVVKIEGGRTRETSDGTIWAIRTVLARIPIPEDWKNGLPDEPDLGKLSRATPFPIALSKSPGEDWLFDFALLKNDELFVSSRHEQFIVDTKKNTYRPVNQGLLPTIINRFEVAGAENPADVWVGGIHELRRIRNGKLTVFPTSLATPALQRMLLLAGENGHIWVVINYSLWDVAPGEDIDFSQPDLVSDQPPTAVKSDRNGNIWIGTLGYGLRKINPAKKLFHAGAAGKSIGGLWRDPSGRYFCKSYINIFPFDPKTGQIGLKPAFSDALDAQINMAFSPSGDTWLLCRGHKMGNFAVLQRYDPSGKFVQSYTFEAKLNLFDQLILSRDGRLWISGYGCQMIRFDPRTGQADHFSFAHLFGEKVSIVRTTALAEDPDGTLWAGTQLGLVKCVPNAQTFDFQLIQADPTNRQGLNNNSIACLLSDPGGVLWIGTKGGGINRLDLKTGKISHITTADGLPNNVVYGILPDGKGEFWCSTNRGLAKIAPRKTPLSVGRGAGGEVFEITSFTAAMGLQDNEFNTSAFSKSENGELLFGGVNGLNRFFPEELRLDTTPPPVFVVGLEINHEPAWPGNTENPLAGPLENLQKLDLSFDQNNLSFEFAALDFTDPAKNRYRYRLTGLDADWVETGGQRFAHFTHLAPGKYTFRVQGSNGESAWREAAHPILIVINPPWWRSGLAYFAYFFLLVWVGWRAYQFQIRRIKEREQLAFEHRETERVKALEQIKTNFFSNVAHEFRTPLTLIIEPLRQVLKNPLALGETATEKIRLAEKNSQRLLGLVNQLLDLAKIESGSMMLDLRRGDFSKTVRTVFESFLPLAEKRKIKLTMAVPPEIPQFEFDENKVELVLNNLISNALKFTEKDGTVKIEVETGQILESSNPQIFIKIADSGIGIAPENLGKIFDRFYQVDGSNTRAGEGTGIGLALSKELAELMGGGIAVESEMGRGSTFKFWLPTAKRVGERGPKNATALPEMAVPTAEFLGKTAPRRAADAENPVVLVVEDNAELRNFIKQSIGAGWQVVEASDGEEGVKRAVELLPDLVVSDVMMPRKDGYQLLDELKNNELTAHIPIILLTAKTSFDSKIRGLRIGADDYLSKPFNTEELLARMENLVETRRRLRENFRKQNQNAHFSKFEISENGKQGGAQPEFLSPPDKEFLRKFNLVLEKNLADEKLGVEDFAKKMFISRVQLHRKLKATTDQNATDFIKNYRLDRAHSMLKNREGMVGEIALRVGFGNEKYFSTVFKEKFGVSPSQVAGG